MLIKNTRTVCLRKAHLSREVHTLVILDVTLEKVVIRELAEMIEIKLHFNSNCFSWIIRDIMFKILRIWTQNGSSLSLISDYYV